MKSGVVKWFDSVKGFGFIAGNDGVDVFVHQSNILMKGFRNLEVGQKVSYQVEPTEKGEKEMLRFKLICITNAKVSKVMRW